MRKVINIALGVVLLVLILGLLLAIGAETGKQDTEKRTEGIDLRLSRAETRELFEIIRVWKLVDELELKEEQLVEFLPRFKELDSLRSEYSRNRRNSIRDLGNMLKTNPSEDTLKSAMDEFRNMEKVFYQKHGQIENELNSNLTIEQQAKFLVFQDKYREDIRRLIRNLRELSDLRERQLKPQPVPLSKKEG